MTMTRMSRWLGFVLFVVAAATLPAQAGLVTRPAKTCGTTSYTAEVAAGCTTIKSGEVDADLNAILTGGVNNIETANINPAGLGTAAFANGSVTGAKIAATTITGANIANNTITSTQLAIGATANSSATAAVNTGLSFTTVETTIVTLGAITTRGGPVLILGSWDFAATCTENTDTLTIRVKRNGTTFYTVTDRVRTSSTAATVTATLPIPFPTVVNTMAAGSSVVTITAQLTSGNCGMTTGGANSGSVTALELS
jgi:hypothetical protein